MFNNVYPFLPQANTRTALSLRGAQRATWQSPGREDLLAYTTTPNTRPRRLRAEKSPAVETKTTVHSSPQYSPAGAPCLARAGSTPVSRRCFRFRFREIPTVTSFPRNDKLLGRVRCLITFIRFYPKRTPVPPCHCEERNARRGNLPEGKTYLRTRPPKYSPAVAHRREIPRERNGNKRTRLPEYSPAGAPCLAYAGSPPSGSATLTETTRAGRFTFSRKYVIIRKTQRQKRKTKSAE